jgi:hypothetical protein
MLQAALKVGETNVEEILDHVRMNLQKKLLLVLDEGQKYYVKRNASKAAQKKSIQCISELLRLGTAKGSSCVFCGSSATLSELALQHGHTGISKDLYAKYSTPTPLNHQKFTPLVLPTVEYNELAAYLEVCLRL